MVHQHFALAESLTVVENVVLGTERLLAPRLKLRAARRKLERLMAESGLAIAPDARVSKAFRRREAAGRDPEGTLPRRPHPRPRRANRRVDAAGGRRALRGAAPTSGSRSRNRLHIAQARRGAGDC